jgi:hypothetical protein
MQGVELSMCMNMFLRVLCVWCRVGVFEHSRRGHLHFQTHAGGCFFVMYRDLRACITRAYFYILARKGVGCWLIRAS